LFKSGDGCDSESREIFVQKEEGRKVELLRSSFELSDEAIREQLQSMMNGHTSPFEGEPVYWFRKGDDIIIKVRIKHWELDRDATFLWKGWSEMSTSELTSYEL
jgi:hypothetical protein